MVGALAIRQGEVDSKGLGIRSGRVYLPVPWVCSGEFAYSAQGLATRVPFLLAEGSRVMGSHFFAKECGNKGLVGATEVPG